MAECNIIMADTSDNRSVIVCELLCYLKCKLSSVKLMSIVGDFYSAEDITLAKEHLVDSVDKLGLEKWPKPAKRKNSENKSKTELNDIFNVFAFLDENLLLNKLPSFVAANVDNLPSSRLEEGDLRCVLNKLDYLDTKLDNSAVASAPVDILQKINDLKSMMGKLTNIENQLASLSSGQVERFTESKLLKDTSSNSVTTVTKAPGRSWAELVETPRHSYQSGGERTSVTAEMDTDGMDSEGYQRVLGKKRKRSPTVAAKPKDNLSVKAKIKPKTIVGSNTQCAIKAAREIRKSKIFYVSNIDKETGCEEFESWLKNCNIKVHNVFAAKTRFENSNAFRVNIDADDVNKFISECGPHLIIREWVFKPQPKLLVV